MHIMNGDYAVRKERNENEMTVVTDLTALDSAAIIDSTHAVQVHWRLCCQQCNCDKTVGGDHTFLTTHVCFSSSRTPFLLL